MLREPICALTGKAGKFVKCHIIPQAFTKPSVKGKPLLQTTKGSGELRRWTSWYDKHLVTSHGEDILSEIDDKAIKLLRKHQLVWSSWVVFRPQVEPLSLSMPSHGYRKIALSDSESLIRFALSVAWRASASSLPDMKEATLEFDVQNQMKDYVLGEKIEDVSRFPVSLIQLSTRGEIHNQSPYIDFKPLIYQNNTDHKSIKILRLYMDGLIFHIHLSQLPREHTQNNPIFIGASDHTFVTTITYEASFQYENFLHSVRESFL